MVLQRIHAAAAVVFLATIVIQVFLAGSALANLGGSGDFATHVGFGYTWVGLAALVVFVTALVARRPRREVGITAGLLVLYVIQTILPSLRGSMPVVAALHPLNAMILFVLAIWYARRAWTASSAA
ncbi:MAG: hypothetical protein HY264_04955 [Chloroflexi bacterium]|nr:hypothetical protein [Chloroflexota bacterium]